MELKLTPPIRLLVFCSCSKFEVIWCESKSSTTSHHVSSLLTTNPELYALRRFFSPRFLSEKECTMELVLHCMLCKTLVFMLSELWFVCLLKTQR